MAEISQRETRDGGRTTVSSARWARLARIVGAPDVVIPWLDRFYEPDEVALLEALDAGTRDGSAKGTAAPGPAPAGATVRSVAELEAAGLVRDAQFVARCHRRGVVTVTDGAVTVAPFLERLALWAQFEGWEDIPADVQAELAEWWLADYTESVRDVLTRLREGHPDPGREADYAYLLLDEAEALVRSQERVYLWPCDCRTLMRACDKPLYNCIRFANDRGLGWEISKERAIEILREADAAGLTHTDYVGLGGESDPHAICNCCTDCCQPHLAAERLGVGDVWPRRRYVAHLVVEACSLCGRCTGRCPFGALTLYEGCEGGQELALDVSACRGCGLCATGCPEGASVMRARDAASASTAPGGDGA